jgi:hypothetical protein
VSVGLAGCGAALDDAETTATVAVSGLPNGLQRYQCTLSQDGEEPITAVDPVLIGGNEFQVVNGGVDSASVVVRAADLSESVGATEESRAVFTVTFGGTVAPADIDLGVGVADDDSGEPIPRDRWSVDVSEG